MMTERETIRIAVRPSAKRVIEAWADTQGMTQTAVATRIYEWFSEQDELVQRGILGMLGSSGPDIARMLLEKMAGPDTGDGGSGRGSPPGPRKPRGRTQGTRSR